MACSYDDLLIIDEALAQLEQVDPRAARVTELRFFAGLDWKFARAWLAMRLLS